MKKRLAVQGVFVLFFKQGEPHLTRDAAARGLPFKAECHRVIRPKLRLCEIRGSRLLGGDVGICREVGNC